MEKFNYETNGYNRSEVNQFIREVIEETEGIISRVQSQSAEIDRLKRELDQYKSSDKSDVNLKKIYQEESEMIINDAKNNASLIVNEALLRAAKIEQKKKLLEKNVQLLKIQLKAITQQQIDIISEIDKIKDESE